MKQLQNNFTTPEQSKRLLELGVPADSADCYLLRTHTKGDTFIVEVLHDELYSKKDKFTNMLEYLPCWSVGRLIELIRFCTEGIDIYLYDSERPNMVMCLVKCIEKNISKFDFSKLED